MQTANIEKHEVNEFKDLEAQGVIDAGRPSGIGGTLIETPAFGKKRAP